jgi:hypothetical protein
MADIDVVGDDEALFVGGRPPLRVYRQRSARTVVGQRNPKIVPRDALA